MTPRPDPTTETNTTTVSGSTLHGSAVVTGSRARVHVGAPTGDADADSALDAVAGLRAELAEARAALDRRDDEAKESLQLALTRLDGLEEELRAGTERRDPERTRKLLTGIRDAVAGVAGLVTSVDGLWAAVSGVLR